MIGKKSPRMPNADASPLVLERALINAQLATALATAQSWQAFETKTQYTRIAALRRLARSFGVPIRKRDGRLYTRTELAIQLHRHLRRELYSTNKKRKKSKNKRKDTRLKDAVKKYAKYFSGVNRRPNFRDATSYLRDLPAVEPLGPVPKPRVKPNRSFMYEPIWDEDMLQTPVEARQSLVGVGGGGVYRVPNYDL
jgi:hypothetical protein